MQGFKKAVSFLLLNIAILLVMEFLLVPPYQYEQQVEAYYTNDYDSIIIGSSYGTNLVPELLPEGEKTLGLSRPRVPIIDFAYIIRELDKHQEIQRVYYDVTVPYWTGELGAVNRVNMMKILSGREQIEYFFKVLTAERYNDFFFRYEVNGDVLRRIPETVQVKLSRLFHTEPPQTEDHGPKVVEEDKHGSFELNPVQFTPDQILPKCLDAFDQLATYCADHDIELIVYVNAYPKERLQQENHGEIHDYFTALLDRYDLELYDLNYVKWEYFPRDTMEYYDVDGHMLHDLAVRQTQVLNMLLTAEDPSQYYAPDYQSVLDGITAYEQASA